MSKQLTISERMKSLICAALVATAITGPIHLGTSMTTAPPAQAFGWSDIKKSAKKVGGAVKKGAKKTGSAVKKGAKKAGSTVKKGAKIGAKYAGKGAKKAAKVTGKVAKGTANAGLAVAAEATKVVTVGGGTLIVKGLGKFDERARRRAEKLRNKIDKAFNVDAIGRGIKKGGKWVGKQAKKSAIVRGAIKDAKAVGSGIKKIAGKLRATAKVPPEKRRGRSSTGHQTGKFKTGLVRDKSFRGVNKKSVARDKSVWGRPVGGKQANRLPIARDKSIWGRPVGGKPPRKVQGIRLKDLKPGRKHAKRKMIGRDKSVFGRPVLKKKKDRRLRNRAKFKRFKRKSSNRSLRDQRKTSLGSRKSGRSRFGKGVQKRMKTFRRQNKRFDRRSSSNKRGNQRRRM